MKKRILALVLAALMALSLCSISVFAEKDPVQIGIAVPDKAVESGESFAVEVKFLSPAQLASNVAVGVQVNLAFDSAKLSASVSDIKLDSKFEKECGSFVGKNIQGGNLVFVAIKDGFSATSGFSSSLSGIFSVTFTAKEKIENAYNLISVATTTALLGDASANEISSTVSFVKAAESSFETAFASSSVTYTEENEFGGSALGNTLAGFSEPTTLSALQAEATLGAAAEIKVKNGDNYIGASDKIGTGMVAELWEAGAMIESAIIIVKGDGDGNGLSDVFDAVMILEGIITPAKRTAIENCALDVDGTSACDVFDAVGVLEHIVKGTW